MTGKNIIMTLMLLCCAGKSFAFMDTPPEQTEHELHSVITLAARGSTSAHARLIDELDLYGRLDLTDHTKTEMLSYIQRLEKSGQFPEYIFERGSYNYNTGSNYLYTTGKNTPVYSLPVMQNSNITSRLNTNRTDYMFYLGEWRQRNGTSWVFAQNDSGKTGWIVGDRVRLVNNNTFRKIITDIQRGIQEYNLAALTGAHKGREEIISTDTTESTDIIITSSTQQHEEHEQKGKKKEAYTTIAVSSIIISLMITLMGLVKYIFGRTLR